MTDAAQPTVVWQPQPGPQTLFLECPCFEVFYGGARGGGKSDAVLGDWIGHANQYGENAIGLIVRRELIQLRELIERSKQLYAPLGAEWAAQDKIWRFPNKARLNFAYIDSDTDAEKYQGHSYCVAVGTRIRMADGSPVPIEDVIIGDMVATLSGPRRVLSAVAPYAAPCIRVLVRDGSGAVVGEQVHPIWHPVLTTAGLISSRIGRTRRIWRRLRLGVSALCRRVAGFPHGIDRDIPSWLSWSGDDRSDCTVFERDIRDGRRPERCSVPVVLHAPSHRSSSRRGPDSPPAPTGYRSLVSIYGVMSGISRPLRGVASWSCSGLRRLFGFSLSGLGVGCPCFASGPSCAPPGCRTIPDFPGNCFGGHDRGDGRVREKSGSGRGDTPSPAHVAGTPHASLSGVLGTIPTHTHLEKLSWVHSYTGEARCLSESVTTGTMEFLNFEWAYVSDLSIEDANHYISADTGLINKNTRIYVEEIGNFPDPAPILKLMATLRSGAGVPCGFRATGNPGGPGHTWVKQRYIDPAPAGFKVLKTEFKNPFTGDVVMRDRVFIPAKVVDNRYNNTPGYIAQLQMAGNERLVKAWLFGDWDIIIGAFFDQWDARKHVIKPFPLPQSWLRFMSGDWGSAKPFAFHWFAVAGDATPIVRLDGSPALIPRGALIVYRELYGSLNHNNVGVKLTVEQVADRLIELESREPRRVGGKSGITYRVLDPACFRDEGGPTIAERFGNKKLYFQPANNRRIRTAHTLGGWDMLRQRLDGEDTRPMIYFFDTCVDVIRTLPALQHDAKNPEDVDTEGEDHAPDSVRYGVMSRPWVRTVHAAVEPAISDPDSRGAIKVDLDRLFKASETNERRRLKLVGTRRI